MYSKDAVAGFQPKTIKEDMLCAGFAEGKRDACKVMGLAMRMGARICLSPGGVGAPSTLTVVSRRAGQGTGLPGLQLL